MKKLIITLLFSILFLGFTHQTFAQTSPEFVAPKQEYYKAEVTNIIKSGTKEIQNYKNFFQFVEVKFLDGPQKGQTTSVENSGTIKMVKQKNLKTGDKIVLLKVTQGNQISYSVYDKYRLNYLYYAVFAFFILIIAFAGLKGFGSILGMIVSFTILLGFIIPQIINGHDPLLVTIIGSMIILITTIYLAHGISRQTTSAVISTFLALSITGILAFIFVKGFGLTGLGDENNYMLQIGTLNINPQGLLLGGIIIGTLGVLDDVTTTQAAAIFEFLKMDKKLSLTDLFSKGYIVGREHISSVVNTLILAYAGASLGLFVIFVLNPQNIPTWVMLNSEMVTEEIIRALVGSIGLVMAVPITTLLASYFALKLKQTSKKSENNISEKSSNKHIEEKFSRRI